MRAQSLELLAAKIQEVATEHVKTDFFRSVQSSQILVDFYRGSKKHIHDIRPPYTTFQDSAPKQEGARPF